MMSGVNQENIGENFKNSLSDGHARHNLDLAPVEMIELIENEINNTGES